MKIHRHEAIKFTDVAAVQLAAVPESISFGPLRIPTRDRVPDYQAARRWLR